MRTSFYKALFLDVGGVLLTNGWDRHMRARAAQTFGIDYDEMNNRHALTFDTYEIGKITLDQYLDRVVFYEPRNFSHEAFKEFMFAQSEPFPEMLQLMRDIKAQFALKVVVVSNEGRELMQKRIERFKLKEFVDFFICSSYVHLRKPDNEIYGFALNMAQEKPETILYVDDRPMLVEIGKQLGLKAICHKNLEQTRSFLMDHLNSTAN